jgi:hypothetical protein
MVEKSVVGEEVVSFPSNDNNLQQRAGQIASLKPKDDFGTRPHRPCFLAIDRRGKVRGRYRFARLAIQEASEHGWELQMEGCDS